MLTTPPGCKEGLLFAEDGVTVLNSSNSEEADKVEKLAPDEDIDIEIKVNLEEVVDANAHLLGNVLGSYRPHHNSSIEC